MNSYEFTTGGKTGFTEKARRTLVSTATKEEKNITVVTLNDGNDWADHESLYESVFNEYNRKLVLKKDNFKVIKKNGKRFKCFIYTRASVEA